MTDAELHEIAREASQVIRELLEQTELREHSVLVVGCSSSEILGGHIGKIGSMEVADAVYQGIAPVLQEKGIDLAAQCCEHLNRAVIVERACALRNGYEIVSVCPWPHAGGSWATTCWQHFEDPVAVEEVRADAGIDIGDTLIGMHLKRVAVPVRLRISQIGAAHVVCAKTRPRLWGGERAHYTPYKGGQA